MKSWKVAAISLTVLTIFLFVIPTSFAKKGGNAGGNGKPPSEPPAGSNPALVVAGFGRFSDIYVLDADGGNANKIVRRASTFLLPSMPTKWTSDGAKVVWADQDSQSLMIVNADGTNQQTLLACDESMIPSIGGQNNLANSGFYCDGSPANLLYFLGTVLDGEWVYDDFYMLDLNDASPLPVRLTQDPDIIHTTLAVSPDGKFIATWTYDAGDDWQSPNSRLEIRDLCPADQPVADLPVLDSWTANDLSLRNGQQFFARIEWSADDILAISGHNTEGRKDEIYLIDLNSGSEPPRATKIIGTGAMLFGEGVYNRRANWSPDGSILAFSSDFEVWTLNIDTGEPTFVIDGVRIRDIDWRDNWVHNP